VLNCKVTDWVFDQNRSHVQNQLEKRRVKRRRILTSWGPITR